MGTIGQVTITAGSDFYLETSKIMVFSDVIPQMWELAGPVVSAIPVEEIALALGLLVSTAGLMGVNFSYTHRRQRQEPPADVTPEEFLNLINGKKTRYDE